MGQLLRRLPLSRLLLLCGIVVALGAGAAAAALALSTGPTPPPKPLAQALHDALSAPPVQGVSARIELTDHLLEGADLAGGDSEASGELSSNPLLSGGSGRLWVAADGRARLELQAEDGDTQVLYDGSTASLYDAASNTLYRYHVPPAERHSADSESPGSSGAKGSSDEGHVPSVAKIEEAISQAERYVEVSGATPTDVAGQAAYTVHVTPKEGGSLIGGAELSWDAVHGNPLRAAVYSTTSSAPVIELAASEISYGPVESSVFEFTPPSSAKVKEIVAPEHERPAGASGAHHEHPQLSTRGHGPGTIAVLESRAGEGGSSQPAGELPEGLQKVQIGDTSASVLPSALGTLLTFERAGVRYLLVGAVTPASIEEVAKGL